MTDNVDDIKKELEEVRRLKEELRREVEDVRREREVTLRRRAASESKPRAPRPPRHVRPVRPIRDIDIDLSGITDSLEDMMDGLGHSIEMSLKGIEGVGHEVRIPGVRISKKGKRGKKIRKSDIEKIPPERVTKIVAPLGSEERLKILEFLKAGGKTFNEIETFTEKTGSSLTHHLNPLVDAGYVVKGEVRGTYYLTVEGRLAYRLAQWLTHRVEQQRDKTGNNGANGETDVSIDFEDGDNDTVVIVEDEEQLERASEHLERVQDEIERMQDKLEEAAEELEEAKEDELERVEALELEDDDDDIDSFDWKD